MSFRPFLACLWVFRVVVALKFPFESIELGLSDSQESPSLSFGNASDPVTSVDCKVLPEDEEWPTSQQWRAFNESLGGRLLQPVPAGAVCYRGSNYDRNACQFLLGNEISSTTFWLDHPLAVLNKWSEGYTCEPSYPTRGRCTQGGFPAYVVNVATVRDVQMAVNFARNHNLRLNIKNTGHDFLGKATGRGSLSVWVHNLKDLEYIPEYTVGDYTGPAVHMGAGVQAWEARNAMNASGEFAYPAPISGTVGVCGGWAQGGGHCLLAGSHGMGADQILSANVILADGRFITADPEQNEDVFYAIRGGGGSTFGITTSLVFKAYPPVVLRGVSYSLTAGPTKRNATSSGPFPLGPSTEVDDLETFWKAYRAHLAFTETTSGLGGFAYGDVVPVDEESATLASMFIMPNMAEDDAAELFEPFFQTLRDLGIDIPTPSIITQPYALPEDGTGIAPYDSVFTSRLIPRDVYATEGMLDDLVDAVRWGVEGGRLSYRSRCYYPSYETAGYPSNTPLDSGLNPAFRHTMSHLTIFPPGPPSYLSDAQGWNYRMSLLNRYTPRIRELTSESGGAYLNEATVLEPDWQRSFYGGKYDRLLGIKRSVDPWDVFWAPTAVGSEGWEVQSVDTFPSQDGRLCRV